MYFDMHLMYSIGSRKTLNNNYKILERLFHTKTMYTDIASIFFSFEVALNVGHYIVFESMV